MSSINNIIIPKKQSCFTWIFFVLKGGIQQSHVSDCTVTPRRRASHAVDLSSSDPFRHPLVLSPAPLTFCQVEQCRNHKQACWDRLHIHDIRHQSQPHFPPHPSCVSSSFHQAVLFHCHPTNTLIAEINTVMRTLMDVLNMHLILNSEGGGICKLLWFRVWGEWRKMIHFGCS